MRLRKQSSGRRWSAPPAEEAPKTWWQLIFFPFSVIALTLMAVILLVYVCSTWLFVEPDAPDAWRTQSAPMGAGATSSSYSGSAFGPPPQTAEKPAGGIVIGK